MAELWSSVRAAPADKQEPLPKPRDVIGMKVGSEGRSQPLPSSSTNLEPHSAKKIRTDEKSLKPKRVNGEGGGGGGNSRAGSGYGSSGTWSLTAVASSSNLSLSLPGPSRLPQQPRVMSSTDKPKKPREKRDKERKRRREEGGEENGELKARSAGIPSVPTAPPPSADSRRNLIWKVRAQHSVPSKVQQPYLEVADLRDV